MLAGYGVAVALVAALGGLAASSSSETYASLDRPPFAPPSEVFGPVWTVLYVMIAVSGWLAWRASGFDRTQAVYAVQLALNLAWTPLFFAADLYVLALVDIVLLAVAIVLTIAGFRRHSTAAALLLVPYLGWVCFATALNAGIVVLN